VLSRAGAPYDSLCVLIDVGCALYGSFSCLGERLYIRHLEKPDNEWTTDGIRAYQLGDDAAQTVGDEHNAAVFQL